jgi:hypothetical protein
VIGISYVKNPKRAWEVGATAALLLAVAVSAAGFFILQERQRLLNAELAKLLLDPSTFSAGTCEPLQIIAGDGAGGRFCLCDRAGDDGRALLYVTSEGQAGTIAPNLAEGMQMMIALPYWRDCLHFSGGGDLDQMRRAQAILERDLRRTRPGIDALRQELYLGLGLDEPVSPLEGLHRAVREGTSRRVITLSDGWVLESLFNTFVIEDNPNWTPGV